MSILTDAVEASSNGSHADAVRLFKTLPAHMVLTPEQLYKWGASLYKQGEKKQAIRKFITVLRGQRNHYGARNALGTSLSDLGKLRLGLVHLKGAAQIQPGNPKALVNIGSAYHRMDNDIGAVKYFEQAHRLFAGASVTDSEKKQGQSVLDYNWAKSLAALGRVELAMEKYLSAATLNPEFFLAHHNLALLLWEAGAYSEARTSWRKAYGIYKQKQNSASFRKENAQYAGFFLLFALNDHGQAERELLFAHGAYPENLQILSNLASLYLEQSDLRTFQSARTAKHAALKFFSAAMTVWDGTPPALRTRDHLYSIVQLLIAFGQRERAILLLTQAPEDVQRSARANALLGAAYLGHGAHTQALVHLRTALVTQKRPQQATRIDLANTLRKTGAKDEAERELKQLLQEAPYNLDALLALGDSYAEMPDDGTGYFTDLAIRTYSLVLYKSGWDDASRPLNTRKRAEVLYARAVERQKLLRLHRYTASAAVQNEVTRDLEQALQNDPENPRALHALKMLQGLERKSQNALFSAAPWLIAGFSLWLFALAQISFYTASDAKRITASEYSLISFGAVLFFTAGCLLPTILRLKFATFELEVSQEPRTRSDEAIILARG
jgi:tetratricopeptide (TPR) repeat protein